MKNDEEKMNEIQKRIQAEGCSANAFAAKWILKLQDAIGNLDEHSSGCCYEFGYHCKCGLTGSSAD